MEIDLIDDEIAQLQSAYLLRQAEIYFVPKPEFKTKDGAWERSNITGLWRLAEHPISELRDVIRREKKERREHLQSWTVLLTGFAGTLIGLFSVLNSN